MEDILFLKWLRKHEQDNFDQLPMSSLAAACQRLGQSGRGTREELIARIRMQLRRYS